ncbi:Uncharacterized conserved protein YjdB, contains Ig-like domain [Flaviramulus basaltis]|uniref:Uncharacterized conserved protein YjdB, contains Ig-like domain n=1 Tax=Flaviramulus basaltis TaxID=369401 RepID=A0A1K2IK03_9FLAO|nr:putative Ig domain-containing protein [Flaviramulus basaltis]SFZ92719.1 Uncharacterized conserved protein YjdB, contains Ig-like domain [Flaviramulus basaltis]
MKYLHHKRSFKLFIYLFFIFYTALNYAQTFISSNLNFNGVGSINQATSLMYGPDGRLYVAEYKGLIKIFTIERIEDETGKGKYVVTAMETLTSIQNIQNHNDDGSIDSSTFRETVGLTVTGTALNPVIYVTSSDYRIGGPGPEGDKGLDTNSGVITRLTKNGNSWDAVDIIRGLPRSEENHATNGLEFVNIQGTDYLIVCSGGITNGGSPSSSFNYTTEYALSAALLSINLNLLASIPIEIKNGRKVIYDIPTLDDPTRDNIDNIYDPNDEYYTGIDVNDPFGGNDGLNQAKIVTDGPVQIFSPGYRNSYDLVVTESGAVYATDNGANEGWGGLPKNQGLFDINGESLANNDYDSAEPGSSSLDPQGEKINNIDHLHLITNDIQNYSFGSFYGGHPNPTRANPQGAGLFTAPSTVGTAGAVFRTKTYNPNYNPEIDPPGLNYDLTSNASIALPADWPPVPLDQANPVEGDWRAPGIDDNAIITWPTNTNGIDEYTASNFGGSMKGNLLAGSNLGLLRRLEFNPEDGYTLTEDFSAGLSGNLLGVSCNSDSDIFPGTIWIGNFNQIITVLEPNDFINCILPDEFDYDANADNDHDGYSNQDEIDNETDLCNGASQPADFDKSSGGILTSDLNDTDDDADGILDVDDPFQLGNPNKDGSDAFILPVVNELFSDNPLLGGYLGLGMTGMMNNGVDANGNWLNWLDRRDDLNDPNPNDVLGGALGVLNMQMTSGTALAEPNNQEKAFQYGVQVDQNTGLFTVSGSIFDFSGSKQLYGTDTASKAPNSELGIFIGDGTQSNYIKFVATPQGLQVLQEINDVPQAPLNLLLDVNNRPNSSILFSFVINPGNGEINLEYSFDNGSAQSFATIIAQGSILTAIQQSTLDLAVGLIGTSNEDGVEVDGKWEVLNVTKAALNPISVNPLMDQSNLESNILNGSLGVEATGGDGSLSYTATNLPPGISINNLTGVFSGTISSNAANNSPYDVTIYVDDSDGDTGDVVAINFTWIITNANSQSTVRINAGGGVLVATDTGVDWEANASSGAITGSGYAVNTGNIYSHGTINITRDPSIPDYIDNQTFNTLFTTERSDWQSALPELEFTFPLDNADYLVNLYMGNMYDGSENIGERIFDIAIEGSPVQSNLDLVAQFGHRVGGMLSFPVTLTDGVLNIEFLHGSIENPLINAIEIRTLVPENVILVNAIDEQTNNINDILDGSLVVIASGGDGNLSYTASGLPPGVSIESTNGQIGGTISSSADTDTPYNVTITIDDEDSFSNDAITLNFIWTVINPNNINPISVDSIANQSNIAGDILDGSLVVSAIGGDGELIYTAAGLPPGLTIDPIEGFISGTITSNADTNSPYNVTFTIDDEDSFSDDAVALRFTWTVINPNNINTITINNPITDQSNIAGDILDGSLVASATGGDGDLSYTATELPPGLSINPITGAISGTVISGSGLSSTYNVIITVDDSDVYSGDVVLLDFTWVITNDIPTNSQSTVRINTGGGVLVATDTGVDWEANASSGAITGSGYAVNTGTIYDHNLTNITRHSSIPDYIDNQTFNTLFTTERSDLQSAPELEFTFPLDNADYLVNLYMGNMYDGSENIGERIFDIAIEGSPVQSNLDLVAQFGHRVGGMLSFPVTLTDGVLNIEFLHGSIENPLINAIEIRTLVPENVILVNAIDEQTNNINDILDGSLVVIASGGDGNLSYTASGLPLGVSIESTNGQIGGTISSSADTDTPYNVTITIDDEDSFSNDAITLNFIWTVINPNNINPISVDSIANQSNIAGDILDGSLVVSATGGDGELIYTAAGLPPGLTIDPIEGFISGTIISGSGLSNTYNVIITVDDSDAYSDDIVSLSFTWNVININNAVWNDKNENENYTARHECSFVQAGDKFYLMGGRENAQTLDVYDYESDSWTALVDSAPVEFNHYQATEYQGLIWVIGAFKTNTFPIEAPADFIWSFNPATKKWIQGPAIPDGRKRGSAGLVIYKDKFYVLAGNTIGHNGGYVNWFDMFDPATGTWTVLDSAIGDPAPKARDHFHAMVIGDKLYAAGGRLSGNAGGYFKPLIPEVDVYDFTSGTWSTLSENIPTPRAAPAVANFNGKLIVIGGEVEEEYVYGYLTSNALKITEEYDPITGTWNRLPDMNFNRHGTQAIVSGNGVYVIAGSPNKGGGNQKKLEYYGVDSPVGNPSVNSIISAPSEVPVTTDGNSFGLDVTGGNIGIPIRSMNITGIKASDFQISLGLIEIGLIKANSTHNISVLYTGTTDNASADLVINYGYNSVLTITLKSDIGSTPVTGLNLTPSDVDIEVGATLQLLATVVPSNADDTSIIWSSSDNTIASVDDNGLITALNQGQTTITAETVEGNFIDTSSIQVLENNPPNITNPLTQNNIEGDVVSLQIVATDESNNLSYSATGLPPLLEIDPNTGLITGTVLSGNNIGPFIEENGLVIIEAESGNLVPTWSETNAGGANGIIAGSDDLYNQSGGTIPYQIVISNPGVYRFNWRNLYSGSSSTDENDTWLKFGNHSGIWFFGSKGNTTETLISTLQGSQTNIVFPKGSQRISAQTTPEGPGSNGFFKVYRSGGASEVYDWQARVDDGSFHDVYVWFENPGTYTMEISERSKGHAIDKIALYKVDGLSYSNNQLTAATESQRGFVAGALEGSPYNVEVTVMDDTVAQASSSVQFDWNINGNSPPIAVATVSSLVGDAPLQVGFTSSNSTDDIEIITYNWDFGDGTTNSSEINPYHTYTNPGIYNAILTVTDSGNLQDSETITITVNGTLQSGVISLTLVDADLDVDLFNLENNHQINIAITQGKLLNFRANTNPAMVGSVKLNLSGPVNESRTENGAPYALFGDNGGGNYLGNQLPLGNYTISATAYSGSGLTGNILGSLTIPFSITDLVITYYTINSSAGTGGSISPNGLTSIGQGTNQLYNIVANAGFAISDVLVDGNSQGTLSNFTFSDVTDNHTISASFTPIPTFDIVSSASTGGSISPDGITSIEEGSNQLYNIVANTGYVILDVIVDDEPQGALSTFTFYDVTNNHTISASFTEVSTYEIVSSAGTGGDISPLGATLVSEGASQSYNIVADAGFTISDVLVDGNSQGTLNTFTFSDVNETHTISASFEEQDGIITFTLIDAISDTDLYGLVDGTQIANNSSALYNIRAYTNLPVGSIGFSLTGPVKKNQTESVAPYALFGDNGNGDYYGNKLPLGNYSLSATAYSGSGLAGNILETSTIQFSVIVPANLAKNTVLNKGNLQNNETLSTDNLSPEDFDIILFPNPASTNIYIRISDSNLVLSHIDMYDISGRLVKKYNASQLKSDKGQYKLDVSGFNDGFYFINLKFNNTTILIYKLIIKK